MLRYSKERADKEVMVRTQEAWGKAVWCVSVTLLLPPSGVCARK